MSRRNQKLFASLLLLLGIAYLASLPSKVEWRARLFALKVRGSLPSVSWGLLLGHMAPSWMAAKGLPPRERVRLGEYNDLTEKQHLARYQFAKQYCRSKTVADIACGTGYGMEILRQVAAGVVGYDKEPLGQKYVIDLEKESWNERQYDVIVSLETIEHLGNPEFFLENVRRSAKLLILSTPLGEIKGANPFHKHTWKLAEIESLLEKSHNCDYFFQFGEIIHKDAKIPSQFIIAVCTPKTYPAARRLGAAIAGSLGRNCP